MGVLSYLLSNQPVGAGAAAVTGRDIVRVSQDPAISGFGPETGWDRVPHLCHTACRGK